LEKAAVHKIKRPTGKHPIVFGLIVTFIFIVLVLISSIFVGMIWQANTSGWFFGSTIGRLVSIFVLLFIVARLDWLHSAGFTSPGNLRTWLILLIPLAYSVATSAYAMTGNFGFSYSDPGLTAIAVPFIISHAFLEEVVFRGLILHASVRAWDGANRGMVMSVLVSSLFFGGYHILYLAGESLPVVLARIVFSTLLGIVFGALVLRGESIYPAAIFHGILNVAGYLNLTSNGTEGTASSWLLMSLCMFPLAFYGLYLLRDLPRFFARAHPAWNTESPAR